VYATHIYIYKSAFDAASEGRTTITIAHRLSTIINANEILVLKDGVVVERGSHSALLQVEKGIFKEMWEAQQQAEAESSTSEESKPETDGKDGFNNKVKVVKMGTKSQGKDDDSDDRGLGLGYHSHGHHSHLTLERTSNSSSSGGAAAAAAAETRRNGGTGTSTDTSVTSGATVSNGLLSKPSGGRTHMI
jgi:ABC-type multidrug transport system ATPase subunit